MRRYSWFSILLFLLPLLAPPLSASAATGSYCQLNPQAIALKDNLRKKAIAGDVNAQREYDKLLKQHADWLYNCRRQHWLKEQAIWLRLYPCDVKPGALDEVLDQIVNMGYNTVYLEVFFDGRVLLPKSQNTTVWPSVIDMPGYENRDLLAETLEKGRKRGLKVYAWLFSLNFGYLYSQRPDRQHVLARNGRNQTSIEFVHDQSQAFVDPYNRQAIQDYNQMLQLVLQRRPDGVLFDYIRYPRGTGQDSVVGKVKDLWIYSPASREALLARARNKQGRWLLETYIDKGFITAEDLNQMRQLFPDEITPLWQGRNPTSPESDTLANLQIELWYFTVAHAAQGVINFLDFVTSQVRQRGIPAGAVFFPEGNQAVGDIGFDSRLQPWDSFPQTLEWHPMSYALCGNPLCIVEQVKRVAEVAQNRRNVKPVLAGFWGRNDGQRPSLESQMEAIRSRLPDIQSISHFAYSWIQPEHARKRQSCRL
ncbi:MAG: family 10 glycosylhydrolase [Geminocystis sp.]|nr:family 10 glycosylhydrolase [Geminocystis sp.]HIK36678.1 family 10 glycosylhydrolase [Geminocystis sp. M7585_C2015_104]MCS7148482.1 family 10 glycosylhydrolase [Geminocystis sp.]MCX8079438.1 family 10 glycosylhydrolase [Geminocystis sp.]MDW8114944.1 family 10 glycosylhydrolase [Geminocystis sp.]